MVANHIDYCLDSGLHCKVLTIRIRGCGLGKGTKPFGYIEFVHQMSRQFSVLEMTWSFSKLDAMIR